MDTKSVVAVILGGGAGSRLYPLTSTRSKPAFWAEMSLCAPSEIPASAQATEIARGFGWRMRRVVWCEKNGGRYRDRTCDPYHVKVMLYR